MEVVWPAGHEPAGAVIHERNIAECSASADAVWAWIVRPDHWRAFYPNALRVRPLEGPWPTLGMGSRFSWITFGARVTTEVTEFEPPHRIAWTGSGLGAVGHHAWVIEPTSSGCRIVTEETQRGLAVRVLAPALRPAMRRLHQRWVEGAARIAESGRTP